MYIKAVTWINEAANEAEVIVTDNKIDLVCFSHPFKKAINEVFVEPIYCFNVNNVVLANEENFYAIRMKNMFRYNFRGVIANLEEKIVHVNNIVLSIIDAEIPKDIPEGGYIEFSVSRLDLL